jgi:hypothetical protein
MSLNVLVIPEDFRKDQYVLGPLVRRLFAEIGKPRARVLVCTDPVMGGIAQALDWERLDEVIDMYRFVDIFLLLVDRDGNAGRRDALDALETKAEQKFSQDRTLIGENAWQEIEVWALAGQDLPSEWNWQEIRAEIHPKETYFEPLARQRGLTDEPGEGRTTMGREAAQHYPRVRSRCREDIEALEAKLKDWLEDD